jgi:hypothetical protein
MLATGLRAVVYRVRRSDPRDYQTVLVNEPLHTLEEITERILEVESMVGDDLKCVSPDFFCDYPYLHPQLEPVDDDGLEELVAEYLILNEEYKDTGKIVQEVRSEILGRMETYPDKILLMSGRTVSRAVVEVKEHMVKGSTQTRLTVGEAK